jgi:hypothetical protein
MANIKISELNPLVTVQDADVLPIVDNAVTKKVTAAILRSYTEGNSVLLTGAQTIAGIKTFTAQLASTVATGTAPFSVASTTKVTNLNADLLDGLTSADFATLTGTQTLTNKTLTSPVINEVLDSNGNEILAFTPVASATDYISIKNGIGVGVPLHISATGSSANTGLHLEPKGTGLVQISDGTDTTKGIRFRSSSSATAAITLIDAVSSAGRVITLPNATTTLVGTNTTDTLTNKSIAGDTNTLSNIGNASLTNSAITINGTSTSLGGSISVGTVTSVAALTLGTSGTDLSSTVATGTTTPVITLNVPTASASNRGALSSADWTTFNAKQATITLTTTGTSGAATLVGSTLNIPNYADTDTGITSLNGLTALTQTFAVGTSGTDFGISSATSTHTFNLPTASAANRGALSSADWTTFNNKQNALTNPITGTGTTNYLPKFTGASALGNSILQEIPNAIGLGVTPLNAYSDSRSLEIGANGIIWTENATNLYNSLSVGLNFYYNGAGNPLYKNTGLASTRYTQYLGEHQWYNAPSGTAGNAITFVQRMTLDASGQLGIGTTTPITPLHIYKASGNTVLTLQSGANYGYLFSNATDIGLASDQGTTGNKFLVNRFAPDNSLVIASTGAATFSSSVTTGGQILVNTGTVNQNTTINASKIAMSRTSDGAEVVYFSKNTDLGATATANIHGYDGIQFRTQGAESVKLTIAESGAATFSSSVTASDFISTSNVTGAALRLLGGGTSVIYQKWANDGGNYFIGISNSTGNGLLSSQNAYSFCLVTESARDMSFGTNNTERMRITSAGNVGIGMIAPPLKLVVDGGSTDYTPIWAKSSLLASDKYYSSFIAGYALAANQSAQIGYVYDTITPANSFAHITPYGSAEGSVFKVTTTGAATFSSSVTAADAILSNLKPSINFTLSVNPAFSHSIVGENYSSGAAVSNYMDLKVANAANTQQLALRLFGTGAAEFSAGLSLSGATAPASGIEFPATQVASASANNLDDYEEGTFTMGITFGGASVGVTYNINAGTYTKVGRQVTVNGYLTLSNKGTSTGSAVITGLPFTIGSTNGNFSSVSLRFNSITFTNQFQGYGNTNSTNIPLEQISVLGVVSDLTDTNFSNSSGILISLTYFV